MENLIKIGTPQPCEAPLPQTDLEDLIYGWERPVSDR